MQDERQDPYDLTYAEADTFFAETPGEAGVFSAEEVAARAVAWLAAHRDDTQPFFLTSASATFTGRTATNTIKTSPRCSKCPPFLPDLPLVRADLATFYERIRAADAAVAAILNALDELDLGDDTFVFFTTDHGPELPRAKMTLYDPGIKAAFVCRWPGQIPGGPAPGPVDEPRRRAADAS